MTTTEEVSRGCYPDRPRTTQPKCEVCAKFPIAPQRCTAVESYGLWDIRHYDGRLEELLLRRDEDDEMRLPPLLAAQVSDKTQRCVRRLQKQLLQAGLLQQPNQQFVSKIQHARVVVPFRLEEVQLGTLLGTGGFSHVYEVQALRDWETTHHEDPHVRTAREHLQSQAKASRYAVKHLKQSLLDDPQRFEQAAMDLVVEAQILLVLDHPNMYVCV